jgi:hypothetical protein
LSAAILALGVTIGGYLLGDGLRRSRIADRAVTVRGLAERDVTADLATWTINYSEQGGELGAVQGAIDEDTRAITDFLPAPASSRTTSRPRASASATSSTMIAAATSLPCAASSSCAPAT